MKVTRKLGDELVKKNLPGFVDMVSRATKNHNGMVAVHPDSFKDEPELMYAAVYYAIHRDIMVTFYNNHGPHPLDKPLRGGRNEQH